MRLCSATVGLSSTVCTLYSWGQLCDQRPSFITCTVCSPFRLPDFPPLHTDLLCPAPAVSPKPYTLNPHPNPDPAQQIEEDVKKRSATGEAAGAKTLCIPFEQPPLPEGTLCFASGKPAKNWALWGRSY